ncbi:alpha-mannosidase [Chelativorans salis]|uniref:Alpha-mannosidase n=1 Tax=Chelativorans salis TaxID=2978478 RepID=A0ABT2LU40_9HYPH|nr:glycoside hydrolase family 38 C-terminal domain-containing protein [Chelativorans sp. EGI FJ00035]MCT7378055.1 alpha-mannosidase [Chelativorans sp. EGI FJ00035]
MTLTVEQRIHRLRKRLAELELWTVRAGIPLEGWTFNDQPLALGTPWPTRDGTVVLAHGEAEVPADWPLEECRLDLDLGGEGLVRVTYAGGVCEGFGLDPNHRQLPLKGRRFFVRAECVARLPFGVPSRDARLARARIVRIDPELCDFALLVTQVAETAEVLQMHEAVPPLLSAGEAALARLDWPSATEAYVARVAPGTEMQKVWQLPAELLPEPPGLDDAQRASVRAAADLLKERFGALRDRYPPSGALAMTGHAHIDLAWLWPLDETRRKANRTFHTMIGLMERNPDFRFNQSTAQLYAFLEEDDPALFERIKEKVAAGQWEPNGAMWVEPDTNMPTGESFVRQLLYGQRYFERHFGKRHTVCWLPDCFGFSPALPQLLRQAGVENFFTIKVNWSETNAMPFDLFWWEGLDGSRVLAHTFNNPVGGYNAEIGPRAALETWRNFRGKHDHPESLIAFGFGDGGGGPTQEMLDRARQLAGFPAVPALRQVRVGEWFEDVRQKIAERPDLPVWVGEMYLELHRGTLTTQGRTKFLHRRAERALITAETLSSMATLLGEPAAASLEEHWRVLLRNQFHDILPGSSIREVYELAEAELSSVVAAGKEKIDAHLAAIARRLVIKGGKAGFLAVNPDLSPRPLRLSSSEPLPGGQAVEGGCVLAGSRQVPGLSAAVMMEVRPAAGLTVEERRLENVDLRVELAGDGTLSSVYDKRAGREVLSGRGNQIWAYTDKPRNWDAWEVEENYAGQGEEIGASAMEVVERGPHRAAIRITRRFRDSTITQTVRLWANSPRLEFKTDIDWHERRILLKARFPLAIRADHAIFECAHGVIHRPTHRNTSWDQARFEVAAHRFADLSEQGYGVALLNDGKYGHHAVGNELGLSLLRSPVYPDPLADEGQQSFSYALFPHDGDWLTGGVLAEAEDLNQPLLCLPAKSHAEASWSAARLDGMALGLSAFKPAEEGSRFVLRVYEPAGARGAVEIALPQGWRLGSEVNLLEDGAEPADRCFLPFQLHSWTFEKEQ